MPKFVEVHFWMGLYGHFSPKATNVFGDERGLVVHYVDSKGDKRVPPPQFWWCLLLASWRAWFLAWVSKHGLLLNLRHGGPKLKGTQADPKQFGQMVARLHTKEPLPTSF